MEQKLKEMLRWFLFHRDEVVKGMGGKQFSRGSVFPGPCRPRVYALEDPVPPVKQHSSLKSPHKFHSRE